MVLSVCVELYAPPGFGFVIWFLLCVHPSTVALLVIKVLLTAWNFGATEVLEPGLILLLAWGLGDVISDLHTAKYIASALEVSEQMLFLVEFDDLALSCVWLRFFSRQVILLVLWSLGWGFRAWISCVDGSAGSTAAVDGGCICYGQCNGDYGWFFVN